MQNEHSRKGGIYKRSIEVCKALLTPPQGQSAVIVAYSLNLAKHAHAISF